MSLSQPEPTGKLENLRLGRRARIAVALLAAWALVASIAFGWAWTLHQQERQSIRAAVDIIVHDIGDEYLSASALSQDFLATRDLKEGWIAAVWLDDVENRLHDLLAISGATGTAPDGFTILSGLKLTLSWPQCTALRYQQVLAKASSDPSILNGTTPYTVYLSTVANLSLNLGRNFGTISSSGNNPLDQMDSPSAVAIRSDFAALYAASANGWDSGCS